MSNSASPPAKPGVYLSANYLVLSEHVPIRYTYHKFEGLPSECIVLAALDKNYDLAGLDVSGRKLENLFTDNCRFATMETICSEYEGSQYMVVSILYKTSLATNIKKGGTKMSRRLEEIVDIDPTQPHVATIMLVDTSGSMSGNLRAINEGLKFLKEDLEGDDLASKRVDLAIVTFDDSTRIIHNFSSIENFEPPTLTTGGSTAMGDAILQAAEMVEERKKLYKSKGMDYFRPWIFMITDGEPTDMHPDDSKWNNVVARVHDGEKNKKFLFFCVAVDSANTEVLKQIAPPSRPPVRLKQGCFKELFSWFSKSQSSVSGSNPGEQVKLETPMEAGWGEIPV
jgi:uncharacterized protein YegL